MDKRLLWAGAAVVGFWALTRNDGLTPGQGAGLPTIRQSQTAASYDATGRPIPYPIGSIVRVDSPPGVQPPSYQARVIAG